jgi:hypothetical protein
LQNARKPDRLKLYNYGDEGRSHNLLKEACVLRTIVTFCYAKCNHGLRQLREAPWLQKCIFATIVVQTMVPGHGLQKVVFFLEKK